MISENTTSKKLSHQLKFMIFKYLSVVITTCLAFENKRGKFICIYEIIVAHLKNTLL